MKILFLARRFHPDIGGVEKHVWEISKRLAAHGHTITIVTQSQNAQKKELVLKNITVLRIPSSPKKNVKFFIWRWFWKQRNFIREADIVHCHDVFFWYLPFRILYSQKPVYTTFHGYESYPIKKKAIFVRKISEKLSWGNICIGDFIKKWYGTKPTFVSYGAVEISNAQSIQKPKEESAVFIGRLDEQTGILTYVKAYEFLKKTFPKFQFITVGDGKYKKNIEKKVTVLGFQKNPEKYFKQYRFAFVSRYLSILEAFAAKRVVITTYDNPVKEDYLKMAPFAPYIIIAKTPGDMIKKITELIYDRQKEKQLIEGAYKWVAKQSWEHVITTYLLLWKVKTSK